MGICEIKYTYKGGEFVNRIFDDWYKALVIEHIKAGPKSSHINPVESHHQSLGDMKKLMLRESGYTPQLWPDTFVSATYSKQSVYYKTVNCAPDERMLGV